MDLIDFSKPYPTDREHRKGWGLSQVGSCITQLVLLDLGLIPEPIDAKTQRLFDVGNRIESQMADEIRARGYALSYAGKHQMKISWGGKNGKPDGIISTKDNFGDLDKSYLWECKSMRSEAFYKLKKLGIDGYIAYYQQAVAYTRALLKRKPPIKVDAIYFTIQNKNDQEVWQCLVEPDWQTELHLENKMRLIQQYVNNKIVPQPTKSWKCRYCGFNKWCWSKKKGVRDKWQRVK